MIKKVKVAIGLGSNVGDRLAYIKEATHWLFSHLLDAKGSSLYETAPWGVTDQPDFLNSVVVGDTFSSPENLFTEIKNLEKTLGRKHRQRYGPREIDLDLLIYGNEQIDSEILVVPHPHLTVREFVLAPLAEVWPDWIHPLEKKSIHQLWVQFSETQPLTSKVYATPLQNIMNR